MTCVKRQLPNLVRSEMYLFKSVHICFCDHDLDGTIEIDFFIELIIVVNCFVAFASLTEAINFLFNMAV